MTTTQAPPEEDQPAPIPIHPKIWTRRVAVTRERGRRRLRYVIAGLALCVVVALGIVAIHTPLFSARQLEVTGAVRTPTEAVLATAGLQSHPPLIDINESAAVKKIEELPWIKTATLSVHWPDSVVVVLTERSAVAAVVMPGQTHQWALVDETGRVLAVVSSKPAGLVAVAVSGPLSAPGTSVSSADMSGVEVASSVPQNIATRVVSVDVENGGGVTLGLTGGITAYMGPASDLQAKYEALASVLQGAAVESGDTVDVSVPQEPTVGPSAANH